MRATIASSAMLLAVLGILGCQSGGSRFSWKKDKSADKAIASTTTPQLPSAGATPPSTTATATASATPGAASTGLSAPSATASPTAYTDTAGGYPATPYPTTQSAFNQTAPAAPASSPAVAPQTGAYGGGYGQTAASDPYAAPPAGGATPSYPAAGGNQYSGATSYGAPSASGSYAPADAGGYRTADTGNRYGAPSSDSHGNAAGGYSTGSAYETSGGQRYADSSDSRYSAPPANDNRYASSADYTQGGTPAGATASNGTGNYQTSVARDTQYTPGNTGYTPGNTGYTPPGSTAYQSPAQTNVAPVTSERKDPFYRPGGTSDYKPASNVAGPATPPSGSYAPSTSYPPSNSYGAPPQYGNAPPPAQYNNPYAAPGAPAGSDPNAASGYGGSYPSSSTGTTNSRYDAPARY